MSGEKFKDTTCRMSLSYHMISLEESTNTFSSHLKELKSLPTRKRSVAYKFMECVEVNMCLGPINAERSSKARQRRRSRRTRNHRLPSHKQTRRNSRKIRPHVHRRPHRRD